MDIERFFNSIDESESYRQQKLSSAQNSLDRDPHAGFYQGRDPVFGLPVVTGELGVGRRSQLHTNVQPQIGQVGVNVGGFDVGMRRSRYQDTNTKQDDVVKQLVLCKVQGDLNFYVRSESKYILLCFIRNYHLYTFNELSNNFENILIGSYYGLSLNSATITSTGSNILDFVVLLSFEGKNILRFDGLRSVKFPNTYKPGTFNYTHLDKNGFWVFNPYPIYLDSLSMVDSALYDCNPVLLEAPSTYQSLGIDENGAVSINPNGSSNSLNQASLINSFLPWNTSATGTSDITVAGYDLIPPTVVPGGVRAIVTTIQYANCSNASFYVESYAIQLNNSGPLTTRYRTIDCTTGQIGNADLLGNEEFVYTVPDPGQPPSLIPVTGPLFYFNYSRSVKSQLDLNYKTKFYADNPIPLDNDSLISYENTTAYSSCRKAAGYYNRYPFALENTSGDSYYAVYNYGTPYLAINNSTKIPLNKIDTDNEISQNISDSIAEINTVNRVDINGKIPILQGQEGSRITIIFDLASRRFQAKLDNLFVDIVGYGNDRNSTEAKALAFCSLTNVNIKSGLLIGDKNSLSLKSYLVEDFTNSVKEQLIKLKNIPETSNTSNFENRLLPLALESISQFTAIALDIGSRKLINLTKPSFSQGTGIDELNPNIPNDGGGLL